MTSADPGAGTREKGQQSGRTNECTCGCLPCRRAHFRRAPVVETPCDVVLTVFPATPEWERGWRWHCRDCDEYAPQIFTSEPDAERSAQQHRDGASATPQKADQRRGALAHRNCMNPDCLVEEGERHYADCTPESADSGTINVGSAGSSARQSTVGGRKSTAEDGTAESGARGFESPPALPTQADQYGRGTVRALWDSVSKYAKTDDERHLLDLGFRTAFQLHPDYWHEFDVLLTPVSS